VTFPTPEELRAAHDAIERDGANANTTMALSVLVLRDPHLKAVVDRLTPIGATAMVSRGIIMAAIATGLNYALRVHEQRIVRPS
jgi:hypothetical protein